jgi:hypothetical protein
VHYIPDPTQAVAYNELSKPLDMLQACGHYIAYTFSVNHMYAFPEMAQKLSDLILMGYEEVQALTSLSHFHGSYNRTGPAESVVEAVPLHSPL